MTLVVGADGLIGGALMAHLKRAGEPVLGTTRHVESVGESRVHLDLSRDVAGWDCPLPVHAAVICAGVTRVDECRHRPAATARVNVDGVATLVDKLASNGAFVVYLSSNQVFDGSASMREPEEPLSPVTEYGRQKAEIEERMGSLGDLASIVRLTKVLHAADPLFTGWRRALEGGSTIQPYVDMFMAPVPLGCVVSVLRLVCDQRLPGVLQVSGERDVSYADAARMGSVALGVDDGLIEPINHPDRDGDRVPSHTTLNVDRLRSALGIEPPGVRWTIERAFAPR